jgi:antitoxin component YwqK of YwqJK toxin-antitoxin module
VWRDYIPGTFYRDQRGFPHGTGTERFFYRSGAVMEETWNVAGVPRQTTWYRPDGSVVASSKFSMETGGVGYYLREDGSIRMKVHYIFRPSDRLFIADGEATHYDEQGQVVKVVQYRDGTPVE